VKGDDVSSTDYSYGNQGRFVAKIDFGQECADTKIADICPVGWAINLWWEKSSICSNRWQWCGDI